MPYPVDYGVRLANSGSTGTGPLIDVPGANVSGLGAFTLFIYSSRSQIRSTGQILCGQWGNGDSWLLTNVRTGELSAAADGIRMYVFTGANIRVWDYAYDVTAATHGLVVRFDGTQTGDAKFDVWLAEEGDSALTDITGSLSHSDPFGGSGGYPATMQSDTGNFEIGGGTFSTGSTIDGDVIDVAFWASALSDVQITGSAMWDSSGAPADHTSLSPTWWWPMGDDDITGTTITDVGSSGNDATLTTNGSGTTPSIVAYSTGLTGTASATAASSASATANVEVNGVASATVASSASADPNVIVEGVASATVASSAAATAQAITGGVASASVTSSASASANVIVEGVASATVASSASAAGTAGSIVTGVASAAVTSSASAGPSVELTESATATVTSSASAIGSGTVEGVASATVASTASADPNVLVFAVGLASASSSAAADPNVIVPGVASASAVSSASATGVLGLFGVAASIVDSFASAQPNVIVEGVASASVTSSAQATPGQVVTRSASGSATSSAAADAFIANIIAAASVVSSASATTATAPVYGVAGGVASTSALAIPAPPWVADVQETMPIAARVRHVMALG